MKRKQMRTKLWTAIMATACLFAQAHFIHARQSPVVTSTSSGSVAGVLKDPSGAVIAGAHVELRSIIWNFHETQISDHRGHYSFVSIPVGNYQLTVTAPGFANQILRPLTVVADAEVPANLSLKIAAVAASVQVDGQDASSIAASALSMQTSSHNSADALAEARGVSLHGNGELATIPFLHGLGDERTGR
jgi:hypothetical protein